VTFLLAHISDVHLGPLPQPRPVDLIGKRLTGYLNWVRARAHIHDMDVLSRLVADLKVQGPDHIAMTGDILNIALPEEFPAGRTWLEGLGTGERVSFVPGNHDAYVPSAIAAIDETFAPWTEGERDTKHAYPYMRVKGPIALIGVTSAIATPPFIASGKLGYGQIKACERLLQSAAERGLARIVILHHPPHRGGAPIGRALSDAYDFEQMIKRTGAELILHGHNHKLSVAHIEGPKGAVPVIGVASGSAAAGTPDHRAGYNLFEIDGSAGAFKIKARTRGLLPESRDIGDLGEIVFQTTHDVQPVCLD
jgi:3',5'-cyclic AMP phosphodiesterase CpdA